MKILVSACLLGENCKYNGKNNYSERVAKYLEGHEVIPVCPEVLGGLPTPRDPSEIVSGEVINCKGVNVDRQFREGAEEALRIAKENGIDLAILQSRSPSCGVKQIYDGSFTGKLIPGQGVFAQLLEKKGIGNFMVDIGGEVVVRGENPKKSLWRIGINKPIDDSLAVNQELQTILQVTDVGIATSGNYRNYYYKDGKKYAHTIDPRTGYPVQHSILSATVIACDCMSADAYATAFMVMGLEEAERFADSHPDLDACFIYADEKGELRMFYTKGMDKYMTVK